MRKVWDFKYAKIIRVIDGDTVEIEFDLGFHASCTQHIRLSGIDAPEPRGEHRELGKAATAFLKGYLEDLDTLECTVKTVKHGKYRYVGDVTLADGTNLGKLMVDHGHAIYREY